MKTEHEETAKLNTNCKLRLGVASWDDGSGKAKSIKFTWFDKNGKAKMIKMGDDEFILYIRKNGFGLNRDNPELGRKIWDWLSKMTPTVRQTKKGQDCLWGDTGSFIDAGKLPKNATQFEFDEAILPELYNFLGTL